MALDLLRSTSASLGIQIEKRMLDVPPQSGRNFLRGQDLIRVAGVNQALRHAGKIRRVGVLRDTQSTGSFDGLRTGRAIRTRTGQDHSDCALPLLLSQRSEKIIDRAAMAALFHRLTQMQPAARQGHREAGPNDVHVIGLDLDPVLDLDDRHGRTAPENVCHQALMLGSKMLDNHVRHAAVGNCRRKEGSQGLDAARRSPYTYDRERALRTCGKIDWS